MISFPGLVSRRNLNLRPRVFVTKYYATLRNRLLYTGMESGGWSIERYYLRPIPISVLFGMPMVLDHTNIVSKLALDE
jgi:hypothetical protein